MSAAYDWPSRQGFVIQDHELPSSVCELCPHQGGGRAHAGPAEICGSALYESQQRLVIDIRINPRTSSNFLAIASSTC